MTVKTGTKWCGNCSTEKLREDFYPRNKGGTKLGAYCKPCTRQVRQDWWEQNKELARSRQRERGRSSHLRWSYGLSEETYARMVLAQSGKCRICKQEPLATGRSHRLVVDHDHSSGKLRALLCEPCNQGLGRFHDAPEVLRRAAEYVVEFA